MAKDLIRVTGEEGAVWRVQDNSGNAEMSLDDGTTFITSTELNILDGLTATTTELNAVADGSGSYVKVTDATTYSILAADSGKLHIMPDLTADCVLSLPSVADGLRYRFMYGGGAEDAHDWQFDTGSDTNFFIGGLVTHDVDDAGDQVAVVFSDGNSNSKLNILTPSAGTEIEFICDGTNWYLLGRVVSTTDAAVTFADQ